MKCYSLFLPETTDFPDGSAVLHIALTYSPEKTISGSKIVDDIAIVLLKTGMFISGTVAFILDNTIPGKVKVILNGSVVRMRYMVRFIVGTLQERRILIWRQAGRKEHDESARGNLKCYDLPFGNGPIYR